MIFVAINDGRSLIWATNDRKKSLRSHIGLLFMIKLLKVHRKCLFFSYLRCNLLKLFDVVRLNEEI